MTKFETVPIRGFSRASATVFRGAAPDERAMPFLKGLGVKTVIDLRSPGSFPERESRWASAAGLQYFNIPVSYFRLSDPIIAAFLAVSLHPRYQPLFVHCVGGEDRTGALVAVYRLAVDGWPIEWAYDEMLAKHFHAWQIFLLRDVHKFAQRMESLDMQQRLTALKQMVEEHLFSR